MTDPLVPPDAGASYAGVYGLHNPWVIWLMNRAPDLVALTPIELQRRFRVAVVRCPGPICDWTPDGWIERGGTPNRSRPCCGDVMLAVTGAFKCHHHPEPVRVNAPLIIERAPTFNALAHTGDILEWQRNERTGEYEVRVLPMEAR